VNKGTVLVTGAAGFIGSNLSLRLLRDGYKIIGYDDFSQGLKSNIKECLAHPEFKIIEGDVTDQKALAAAWGDAESVIHLAAFKIPRYGNALKTLEINVHGSENVLRLAKERKNKVVLASTSDVYGKNAKLPFSEEHDLVMGGPKVQRWSYAISKMLDEQLALAYSNEYDLPVVLMRFFGSYGKNQNLTWWGGPQSVFIAAALEGEPITVHGDGQQTRSFTYIDDTVEGITRCLETPEAVGEVFNIGNNREITISGLAEMIWRLVGRQEPARIKYIPYENFGKYEDVRRRVPDIEKAKRVLGFTAKVDLEEGLSKTIEWQKSVTVDKK